MIQSSEKSKSKVLKDKYPCFCELKSEENKLLSNFFYHQFHQDHFSLMPNHSLVFFITENWPSSTIIIFNYAGSYKLF